MTNATDDPKKETPLAYNAKECTRTNSFDQLCHFKPLTCLCGTHIAHLLKPRDMAVDSVVGSKLAQYYLASPHAASQRWTLARSVALDPCCQ